MRTKRSLINMLSMLIFNLIIGVLGFIKVRVFVNGLSNDIYSLNQLFYQVFSYIAITDIGFGLLLNKELYNAFAKNDNDEVNRIYSTSKRFYKIIAFIMLGISIILSFIIHYFTKANVSTIYIQLIFIIFTVKNIIDYFFVAPRYVLEADQKLYKVNHYVRLIKILETIVEIILVLIGVDYFFILIPGIFITIIIDIIINKKIFKFYPWLKDTKTLDKKYLKGTKDVIWRKLAGLLGSNTDIILISTFINPLAVIIYTSYVYITKFITDTLTMVSNAILPSFANVILKENKEKGIATFNEVNIFFFFIASFVFIMLFGFLDNLIILWVGKEYVTSKLNLLLFCFIAFQLIAERTIYMTVNAKGLFKETKKSTVLEAILNLTISLILVNKIGLTGVLIGTIVAKLLTTFIEYPIYIYRNLFDKKCLKYYLQYCITILICVIFIYSLDLINLTTNSAIIWVIQVLVTALIVGILLFIIFAILFKSFRALINRGIEFIKLKGKYTE